MRASTGPKHDYTQSIDHVIMNEMLGYIDQLLKDASEYLYELYRIWSTHYITNHVGNDVLEVLVSGRRRAWWHVRPIMATRETQLATKLDPEHCRIRWDEDEHAHSNVIVLIRDEMTGHWNATIIEPGGNMCQPFVRLIRRLFSSTPTLRMCKVRLVAAHAQRKYAMYCLKFMLPKRRFWMAERTFGNVFSK
jgi:hypothetical protein